MCKYCQGLRENEFIKLACGTYADLYLGFASVGGWQLHVDMHPCPPYTDCPHNVCYSGEENGFRIPALTQNFPVNFCPMCGRPLEG